MSIKKISINIRKKPKHNKSKKKSFRVKTSKYKRKTRRHKKTKRTKRTKRTNAQRGGVTTTNLINAARHIPHTITNTYNGLVGNAAATSFLPWTGHY
jgi:hypothetical protein